MGQASPVSLGVPSANGAGVNNGSQQMQMQEQRRRINAILQDYELQRRLHADTLQFVSKTRSRPLYRCRARNH